MSKRYDRELDPDVFPRAAFRLADLLDKLVAERANGNDRGAESEGSGEASSEGEGSASTDVG